MSWTKGPFVALFIAPMCCPIFTMSSPQESSFLGCCISCASWLLLFLEPHYGTTFKLSIVDSKPMRWVETPSILCMAPKLLIDCLNRSYSTALRYPRLGQPSPVFFPLPLLEEWATFSASGVTSYTRIASLRLLEYGLLNDAIFEILAKLMKHCRSPTRAPWLTMTTTFVLFLLIF